MPAPDLSRIYVMCTPCTLVMELHCEICTPIAQNCAIEYKSQYIDNKELNSLAFIDIMQ